MHTTKRTALSVAVLLLSLLIAPLQAQDREAPRDSTRFLSSPTAQRSAAKRPALEDRFIIGFNWGPLPDDSAAYKALRIKVVHEGIWQSHSSGNDSYPTLRERMPWGTALIHSDQDLSQGDPIPYSLAPSMQYDPVLENIGTPYQFKERLGDTTGAVWGFQLRDTTVGKIMKEDPSSSLLNNYGRMTFRDSTMRRVNGQNGLDSAAPRLVLSQIYPNKLQFLDGIDGLRRDYDRVLQHPDLTFNYNTTDMYIFDRVRDYYVLRFHHYHRDSLGNIVMKDTVINGDTISYADTVPAPRGYLWLDTTLRQDDLTVVHMKGDSTEWWLSTNLRRLVNPDQNSTSPTSIVMSLRVPMVIRYDTIPYNYSGEIIDDEVKKGSTLHTVYARFDSTSVAGDTIFHDHYGCMDKTLAAYNDTVFYIRAGMLPPYDKEVNGEERPDITLSAHFWLPRFEENNRYETLKPNFGGGIGIPQAPDTLRGYPKTVITPVVVKVDMEVNYHGNVDIGLDWTRFESRLARMILRGVKDSVIERCARKWYRYVDSVAPDRGHFMHSHYLYDEGNGFFWRVQRHMSRILEDIGTVETGSAFRGHYRHQTRDRQHWISWLGPVGNSSAPYLRYGSAEKNSETNSSYRRRKDRAMGLFSGYSGAIYIDDGVLDTLDYDFETGRRIYDSTEAFLNVSLSTLPDSLYRKVLYDSRSVQANFEYAMDERVINSYELLYGPLPVWYNTWSFSEWTAVSNTYSNVATYPQTARWTFTRPHTGEEVRAMNWLALALGGKGLMPYKGASTFNGSRGQYGLTCYPSVDGNTGRKLPNQGVATEGGDFLDSLHTIWSYMNVDSLAWSMGIPKNRFYVGTKSTFDELTRVHGFADDNSAELMSLQLQAIYSKGYKLITSRRDTSVHMERYLDTTTRFFIRKIHHPQGSGWFNPVESFTDSTFFLVTLLKDTAKSMDEVFYVGMVNRRTDPTVYYPSSGGTDLGGGRKFFSTNEFNGLIASGGLNHYTHPEYAQAGSREMLLPLPLGKLFTDSAFSLVRIKEVGGTLDTIIPEDKIPSSGIFSMSFRFKPGEGKLLRVSILHPGTIPEGELSYSNQRKMVSVPEAGDTTKVRYYMVYHRWEKSRYEVFYRYSKPTARVSDEANIVWEAEEPLSMMIRKRLPDGKTEKFDNLSCAYPSLVVRPAEWGKQRVYVVFGCEHPDEKTQEQWIVENNFTPTAPPHPMPIPRSTGDVIATASGRTLADWGTPVVSAVDRGNIYAWADSVQGIVLGFKPAIVDTLTDTLPVRWSSSSDSAQHPSLATYARYEVGENSTALVWQEDEEIYYASPFVDAAGDLLLRHFPLVYDGSQADGGIEWLPTNIDSTILAMCTPGCTRKNRLPVVYRGIEPSNRYASSQLLSLDRVAWEGQTASGSWPFQIYSRWIDLVEDTTQANWPSVLLYRSGMNKLYSTRYSFHQADIAQGALNGSSLWWNEYGSTINGSDSAFVLSFISWDQQGSLPYTNTKVWHLPHDYTISTSGDSINPINLQYNHTIAQNGLVPHQTARPFIGAGSWWQNRRIFEHGEAPQILPSAQYYYRIAQPRHDYSVTKVMAFTKACSSFGMFEPMYKEIPIRMIPKVSSGFKAVDTLVSDPFPVGSATEVSFYVTGSDTSLAKAELVEIHSGTRYTIPLAAATDTTARLVAQTFTNGGGNLYRLEFLKGQAHAGYTTNQLAGQIPLQNSSGTIIGFAKAADEGRSEGAAQIANLAVSGIEKTPGLHAYVYPNPAQDKIAISVYRTYTDKLPMAGESNDDQLLVRVISILGTEVARFETRTGALLDMPIKHLPKGVYFVRVEQIANPQESGATSFVVE